MTTPGFTKKKLDITFVRPSGKTFAGSKSNSMKLSGLRISANIVNAGLPSSASTEIRVYGMTQSTMNELTVVRQLPNAVTSDEVLLEAGDAVAGMSTVFRGTIASAMADYQTMPEVSFVVIGIAGLFHAVKPIPPSSYQGTADVATVMQSLASQMGLGFENNGVSVILNNPYFPGTAGQQMQAAAEHAGIEAQVIDQLLCIWPKNGSRGGSIPLISAGSGLIGYPTFDVYGPSFRCLYTPNISFGRKLQLKSTIKNASGTWGIRGLSHYLETERRNGKWESAVNCQQVFK